MRDPIGKHITLDHATLDPEPKTYQIVGVVGDSNYMEIREPVRRALFLPAFRDGSVIAQTFIVRTGIAPESLAAGIKNLPLRLTATRPLAEAISSAGGVLLSALDENLMLKHCPGLFCAGEMLDWEAPTGGYLLTACFATGRAAGLGIANYLERGVLA